MFSLLSGLTGRDRNNWCSRVSDPMRKIEDFYTTRTEISLKQRRRTAYEQLLKLEGISPYIAKTILLQWDDTIQKSATTSKSAQRQVRSTNKRPDNRSRRYDAKRSAANRELALNQLKIGELLQKAHLISPSQLDIALMEQRTCSDERLGEIISRYGWVNPRTVEFFISRFPHIHRDSFHFPIGRYLKDAALLDATQIGRILQAQSRSLTPVKFGSVAVSQGYVRRETVDLILQQLATR